MSASDYAGYRDWKQWTTRPFGKYSREHAVYFADELRRSGVGQLAGLTVLEVGFGNGEFAAWARDAGATYHGTELLADLVTAGVTAGFSMHHGNRPVDTVLGEAQADLIVAFDVFEHLTLEDLQATLRSVFTALRPGGRLIFRVPSGDSPFSRAIQHGDTTHRVILGSSMIHQIAPDSGFTVAAVRATAWPLRGLGFMVFVRRALVAGIRASVFAVMKKAFLGGGDSVLTPTMVCVLVKP